MIPPEKVKPGLFIGCNRLFRRPISDKVARKRHNKPKDRTHQLKSTSKVLKGLHKKMAKLEKLGIQYQPKELVSFLFLVSRDSLKQSLVSKLVQTFKSFMTLVKGHL